MGKGPENKFLFWEGSRVVLKKLQGVIKQMVIGRDAGLVRKRSRGLKERKPDLYL